MSSISIICRDGLMVQDDSVSYHLVKGVLQEKGYDAAAENVQSVRVLARSLHVTFVADFPLGWEVRRALIQEFGIGDMTEAPNGTSKYLHRQEERKHKFPVRRMQWR